MVDDTNEDVIETTEETIQETEEVSLTPEQEQVDEILDPTPYQNKYKREKTVSRCL